MRVKLSIFRSAILALLVGGSALAQEGTLEQPIKREKNTPEAQLRFAEGLLSRKFYAMAEDELRAFLDKYPNHELAPSAMFRLIECLRAQDRTAETLSSINQFLARWPHHALTPRLFLYKGELLLQKNEVQQAQACFSRLKLSTDSVIREAALYFLADSYARQGKIDLALRIYTRLAANPFDDKHVYRPYAVFALASAFQRKGRFADAEKTFARLEKESGVPAGVKEEALYRLGELHFLRRDYQGAAECYEAMLVEFPDGGFAREGRKRRAWAYFELKQFDKALELIHDWKKRYPGVEDYEIDYLEGAALMAKGVFAEALPLFEKLAREQNAPEAYREMGAYYVIWCRLRLEQFPQVLRAAEAFLETHPKSEHAPDVYYFSGEAYFRLKQYPRAVGQLRKAINSGGAAWEYALDASIRLADALEQMGNYKGAAAVYRDLSRTKGVSEPASFLFQAGECERKGGDIKAAIADYEGLWVRFPTSAAAKTAAMRLGELYAARQQYARAEKFLRGLLKNADAPTRDRLVFFLGYLAFRQKKYAEAEKELRAALAGKGDSGIAREATYYLAGTLLEEGKNDEALSLFGQLLKLAPEKRPPFDDDLLFRLEKLYYLRHEYDVSESICRWVLARGSGEGVFLATMRLARILLAENRVQEAQELLEGLLAKMEKTDAGRAANDFSREQVSSLLGEVFLLQGQKDRAVNAFEQSLVKPGLPMEASARSHWGLARILKEEGRLKQALYHAVNAFLTCKDPTYTPRAMLIAVEIFHAQKKDQEALTTWKELTVRFPSFAGQHRDDPTIRAVVEAGKAVPAPEPPQKEKKP